jgi:hypothetical protein
MQEVIGSTPIFSTDKAERLGFIIKPLLFLSLSLHRNEATDEESLLHTKI